MAWDLLAPPKTSADAAANRAAAGRASGGALRWMTGAIRSGADTGIWAQIGRLHANLRPWGRIYAIAFAYVFVLLPGVWFLRYHRRPVAAVFAGLAAVIVVSSMAFRLITAPPSGETVELHYALMARVLDGKTLDCTLWGDLLAGAQATLQIRAPGAGQLYGVHSEYQPVQGLAAEGESGGLTLRLPPFSTRQFVTRYRIPQPAPHVRLLSVERLGRRLQKAEFVIPSGAMPAAARLDWRKAGVMYGRHVYRVAVSDGRLVLQGLQSSVDAIVRRDVGAEWEPPVSEKSGSRDDRVRKFFEALRQSLMVRALDLATLEDAATVEQSDAIILAVPARSTPDALLPECSLAWQTRGCTIYVYRFAIPAP